MATIKKTEPFVEMRVPTYHIRHLVSNGWLSKLVPVIGKLVGFHQNNKLQADLRSLDDDATIINRIIRKYWRKQGVDKSADRALYRAKEVKAAVDQATAYVDFGCGDRSITEAVGKMYGLQKLRITGVDLFDSGSPGSLFANKLIHVGYKPDLITCFVSLHHVDIDKELDNIRAVAAPDCKIVVREHDMIEDINFYHYLQFVHIAAAAWDTAGDLNEILDSAKYYSKAILINKFQEYGFGYYKLVDYNMERNPQRLFYIVFSAVPF